MSQKNISTNNIIPSQVPGIHSTQDGLLIWLDSNIDVTKNKESMNTISKLKGIINSVEIHTDIEKCIKFIKSTKDKKIFIVTSGTYGQKVIPDIHDIKQICAIYIFCANKSRHEQWAKDYTKINGVFTDIDEICDTLSIAIRECSQNRIPAGSIFSGSTIANQDLNRLDPSFMYTQILKEILLTINFEAQHIDKFSTYCRKKLVRDTNELKDVEQFQLEYSQRNPIYWYTYNSFLHQMLNRSLSTVDINSIIKLGFFIRDLHNQIEQLHLKQYSGKQSSMPFIVYHGQGFSQADFNELEKKIGGLYSFKQFLLTCKNRQIAFGSASRSIKKIDQIYVFFVMTIDPSITSTPFAKVPDKNPCHQEEEIILSMNSVFRIQTIKQIDGDDRLWQVDMTLTNDYDPQLEALTERLREETCPQKPGWYRLGLLSIKAEQFDVAEEIFNTLLDKTTDDREKADIYNQLGMIKSNQEKYSAAISFYEKCLEMKEKFLPPNHPDLASCYKNIGAACEHIQMYNKAILCYKKVLGIYEKTLPPNHPSLATSYHSVGLVLENMKDYQKALSFYEKAFEIHQKTFPSNHPSLAASYNNIGKTYEHMKKYQKALPYYEKVLEINKKSLPTNHPSLAASFVDVGLIYSKINEYQTALSYYEKGLEIYKLSLPPMNGHLHSLYDKMGAVYYQMGDYGKALSFNKHALDIAQHSLPPNHPALQLYKKHVENAENNFKQF